MTAMVKTWPDTGELVRRVNIRLWEDQANTGFSVDQEFDAGIWRWSKIEPVLGGDFWGAKQIGESITHKIWVRYGVGTRPQDLTGQYVIDCPSENMRYRVMRALDVNNARVFTAVEVLELGAIT